MRIVLRKSPRSKGHVEIVEVDGDPGKVPASMTYESEEEAITAVAQYLGVVRGEIDQVTYRK